MAELGLRTYNHYISWRWREREGSGNSKNDDNDPFHINWQGFDFTAYDGSGHMGKGQKYFT